MNIIVALCVVLLLIPACKSRPERPGFAGRILDTLLPRVSDSVPNEGTKAGESEPATVGEGSETKQADPIAPEPGKVETKDTQPPATKPVATITPADIAKRFAPILWIAPQEPYYPMDPEEFYRKPANERSEEFFRSARRTYKAGKQARVVVNISEDKRLLQYWIFHAKNGCQGLRLSIAVPSGINNPFGSKDILKTENKETAIELCNLAIHEGDWENITLKLNGDSTQIEMAYLSAHGQGNWLPPSALRMKGRRPLIYSALNSHALYPSDIDFAADATIAKDQLGKVPSLQWFQVGDAIKSSISMQSDTSGGEGAVEFDSAKALWMWDEFKNTDIGKYKDLWGNTVDGKKVLPPPKITNVVTSTIFEKISEIAFEKVPLLNGKSNGNAPPSPWARDDWKNFDCANCGGRKGLGRMALAATGYGDAFDDFEKIKPRDRYKLKQIRASGKGPVTRICAVVDGAGDFCHGGSWDGEQNLDIADDDYLSRLDVGLLRIKRQSLCFGDQVQYAKGQSPAGWDLDGYCCGDERAGGDADPGLSWKVGS